MATVDPKKAESIYEFSAVDTDGKDVRGIICLRNCSSFSV